MYGRGVSQRMQARGAPSVILANDSGGLEQLGKRVVDIVLPHRSSIPTCQEGGLHTVG